MIGSMGYMRQMAARPSSKQLSLSLGICAGATALGLAMRWHGHARPGFDDFSAAI